MASLPDLPPRDDLWASATTPADEVTHLKERLQRFSRQERRRVKAKGVFLAAPADAVKLFDQKIKPVAALDPKQVQRWLADLGSEEFAVRDPSVKALEQLDRQAIPHLEAALKSAGSLEVRRRLEKLLEQQQNALLSSEQLRQMRAVMVLELIGDGEAKSLLKRWASGPAGALLTMDATDALKRLEAASKTKR